VKSHSNRSNLNTSERSIWSGFALFTAIYSFLTFDIYGKFPTNILFIFTTSLYQLILKRETTRDKVTNIFSNFNIDDPIIYHINISGLYLFHLKDGMPLKTRGFIAVKEKEPP
jgi:hypothetical protein